MPLHDYQLPDGTMVWCRGFRDGLPVFGWGEAPADWKTKRQLWAAGLRRRPGQDPVGLLVWRRGRRTAELFDSRLALPKRPMTPRWQEAIIKMHLAHYVCRRCGQEQCRALSPTTWMCWPCMEETGDFGQPPGVVL